MLVKPQTSNRKLDRLERAIRRARLALGWERLWPRLVPILSVVGLYVVLSWFGFWRLGGDWLRLSALAVLGLALLFSLARLAWLVVPGRLEAMRRVEVLSGLPHRPARGLADRISPVADDGAARALWAANQARLYASLRNLKAGAPRPQMAERDPNGFRFAVPVLLALAFAVSWGEWMTRLGEAFSPVTVAHAAIAARVDAWIDPPPYTGQAPVFLSRRTGEVAGEPVSVPEGSKLTVRVVSRQPAEVTVNAGGAATALAPKEESRAADSEDVIRSYEAILDQTATIGIADPDGTASYPVTVTEDRPPTIARGPLTASRAGSFTLGFDVTDDYGVTEGNVTFRPAEAQPEGARPLVEPPSLPLRIDRAQARQGVATADGRLEEHPYAGLDVAADAFVKDAADQEARPADAGPMALPARPFYRPLARALIEQRRLLALDANRRDIVALALDALTVAPEQIPDSGTYLALRVGYHRLLAARDDDDLREMLEYLWTVARAIEDGDVADAEEQLNAARQALEKALEEGASQEEIARLMDELRQAMQEFLESYAAEMAERGMQNMPMPNDPNMQTMTEQDLQEMLDRIEDLAELGDRDAAQQLLSELQQMLDNLQMAQPGQMQPGDQQMMEQMDELADIMREQQRLMDETFQLNQGRR
ncbi:MAG: TIGR02302 family protein, partial [Rhizobiales bacterium]|nr:TIGR02302 family protein [Hyphomicrobiales bacterium]